MTEVDTSQYAAVSGRTEELVTRDGRVLLSSRTEWENLDKAFGGLTLIPVVHPLFGAKLLDDRGGPDPLDDVLDAAWKAALRAIEAESIPQRYVLNEQTP